MSSQPLTIPTSRTASVHTLATVDLRLIDEARRIAKLMEYDTLSAELAPAEWYAYISKNRYAAANGNLLKSFVEIECAANVEPEPCTLLCGCKCGTCPPAQGESPNGLAHAVLPSNAPWGMLTITENAPNAVIHAEREELVVCKDIGDHVMDWIVCAADRGDERLHKAGAYLQAQWRGFRASWADPKDREILLPIATAISVIGLVSFLTWLGYR